MMLRQGVNVAVAENLNLQRCEGLIGGPGEHPRFLGRVECRAVTRADEQLLGGIVLHGAAGVRADRVVRKEPVVGQVDRAARDRPRPGRYKGPPRTWGSPRCSRAELPPAGAALLVFGVGVWALAAALPDLDDRL